VRKAKSRVKTTERSKGVVKKGHAMEGEGADQREQARGMAENSAPETKEPKDFAEVRNKFTNQVRISAGKIIGGLIRKAEGGQASAARYLFELVGLYPATEETLSDPEDSLAYALYKRMGLPDPVVGPAPATAKSAIPELGVVEARCDGECRVRFDQGSREPRPDERGEEA
jgi:hypothetical protein